MSFGAYFGLGLIRDLWRIPEYVKDYNNDPEYLESLTNMMRKTSQPPTSFARHFGAIIIADILGYLVIGAIPPNYFGELQTKIILAIFVPLACAIGT